MLREVLLAEIAHGRSGDKGNHANVALIAYNALGYSFLCRHYTAERIAEIFAPLSPTKVERFEAANLLAVNFLLYNVLAGGGSRSLRSDAQGKSLAMALLQTPLPLGEDYSAMRRPTRGHLT